MSGIFMLGAASNSMAQFALGADVSWLQQSEAMGQKFYDKNGVAGDGLKIMRDLGINAIRLRTWVNPNNTAFSGHCSQRETIEMSMRCKKLGMRVMVDFHYADTWVSVGTQSTPKAWQGLAYPEHKAALAAYTTAFCKAMKDSGVTPAWFQIGNEINSGLNPPNGSRSSNPVQMTGLLNAGYDAVKAVFPTSKVLIHVAQPQKTEGDAMLSTYKSNGGKMDAIGWSSYANDGNVDAIVKSVQTWKDKYKLETIMVEIGSDKAPANNKTLIEKWNAGIESMNNACEGGTFYWEPQAYGPPGNWADAIFDNSGKPTEAFDAYSVPLKKACGITSGLENSEGSRVKLAYSFNSLTRQISIRDNGNFNFRLLDLQGKILEVGHGTTTATLQTKVKTGLYFLTIQNAREIKTIKISN
jgi:arabinogalactan endo-1,4-beta-galactosidase